MAAPSTRRWARDSPEALGANEPLASRVPSWPPAPLLSLHSSPRLSSSPLPAWRLRAPAERIIQPPGRAASRYSAAPLPPLSGEDIYFSLDLISHFSRDKALYSRWGDTLEGRKRFPDVYIRELRQLGLESVLKSFPLFDPSVPSLPNPGQKGAGVGVGKNRLHVYIKTSYLQGDFPGDYCSEIHPMLTFLVSTPPSTPASFHWQATEPKRSQLDKLW